LNYLWTFQLHRFLLPHKDIGSEAVSRAEKDTHLPRSNILNRRAFLNSSIFNVSSAGESCFPSFLHSQEQEKQMQFPILLWLFMIQEL
jgi:hypothetical protein